jgi:hypothetical protein
MKFNENFEEENNFDKKSCNSIVGYFFILGGGCNIQGSKMIENCAWSNLEEY